MLTGGQSSSLSTADGALSPTACDFEPNSWPNRSPSDGLESDEAPNMLPPPHPDSKTPAKASASAARSEPVRPAPIVCLLRIIQMSPRCPGIACSEGVHGPPRVIIAQWRRSQGTQKRLVSKSRNK